MTAKRTPTPQAKRLLELEQQLKQGNQQTGEILNQNATNLELIWEVFNEQQSMLETLSLESSKQSETIIQQSEAIERKLSEVNSKMGGELKQERASREMLEQTMTSLTQSVDTLIAYLEGQTL
ncbi:hypothetical protein [Vibrio splendidus]|uniref:hypothetical protein n=1 Tax=Vibrio splendidus TaxID=29497 RepID=UPI0039A5F858